MAESTRPEAVIDLRENLNHEHQVINLKLDEVNDRLMADSGDRVEAGQQITSMTKKVSAYPITNFGKRCQISMALVF